MGIHAIQTARASVRRVSFLRPVTGDAPNVVAALADWLAASAEPEPLIIETSGSSGVPKRVLLSRRAVLASVAATTERQGGAGRWVLALPAAYVAGVMVVARSLVAGQQPLLVDSSGSVAKALAAEHASYTSLVPTQLRRLLGDPVEVDALRRLDTVLLGGGPIDRGLRSRAEELGVRVVATYGMTETAGGCVYDGRPLPGVNVAVDDGGRIRVSGPMLFDGYDADPVLTGASLQDGWFLTSDAGRLEADGRLTVLGRLDDIVISGGVNVPTAAVAARLREHPAVAAAEVVGVDDPEWGQRVVAFVVGAIDEAVARDWVAEVHPRSWAPRQVICLGSLPLLEHGKVDRLRLRGLA